MALIVLKVLGWLVVLALLVFLGLAWLVDGMSPAAPKLGREHVVVAAVGAALAALLWFA